MAKQNPFLKKASGTTKVPASVEKRHGLGRGLDSLIPTSGRAGVPAVVSAVPAAEGSAAPTTGFLEIPIADIQRSPYQPRREFRDAELKELSESIKSNGLVQPPTVRKNASGRYELIAGERRLRAAQLLGWKKIRVNLIAADDLTAAAMTTTENINREDLNPIEEAVSYKTLQDTFGLTQQEVADRVGKGRATVANSTRLLELPDEVRALVQERLLSVGHAKVLLSVEDEKDRIILARDAVSNQLPVRALERKVERLRNPVPERPRGKPDLPDGYLRHLCELLKKHLGCPVRLTSGVLHENGKHTKGVLEVDFFDNDDLDRVLAMIGVKVD